MAVSVTDDVPQQNQSSTTVSSKEYGSIALQINAENLKTSSEDAINEDQQTETETLIDQNLEEVPEAPQPTVSNNSNDYTKIFVGGLEDGISGDEFFSYFELFGRLVDKVVIYNNMTKKRRGFGFVTYDNKQSAENVLRNPYHEIKTGKRQVEVKVVRPKRALAPNVPAQQQYTIGHYPYNHMPMQMPYYHMPMSYDHTPMVMPYGHTPMVMPYDHMPMQYNHMPMAMPYDHMPMTYNHMAMPYSYFEDHSQIFQQGPYWYYYIG